MRDTMVLYRASFVSVLPLILLLCFACQAAGLSTEEGPWFTSEPSSWLEFTNQTGGSVSCSAGGHPAPQVVWMTAGNDAALIATGPGLMTTTSEVSGLRRVVVSSRSGESGDSLIYNNASLIFMPFSATAYRPDVHSTTYRCRATNSAGTILSREMKLKTVMIQAYEAQAVGGSAMQGGVAVLRCALPPAIRSDIVVSGWIQDFTGLVITPSMQGDGKYHMLPSTGDLYVYGVEKSDGRFGFRCRTQTRFTSGATSATGAQQQQTSPNAASIIVTDAAIVSGPSITSKASSIQVESGKSVTIPCLAQGYPTPEIRWYRLELNNPPTPMEESVASFGVLVLEHVQPEDAGTYRCTAVNSAGQTQHDIRLEVIEPLRVELEPSSSFLRVHQGHSVTLQCTSNRKQPIAAANLANGLAQQQLQYSSIKWVKDGLPISSTSHPNKYHIGSNQEQPNVASGWMRIDNMQRTDQGIYQCFVQTDRESAQTSIRLILGDAVPHLVHTFNEQTLIPGPSVTLRCSATGNPLPDITWFLDRQPLLSSSSRVMQNQQRQQQAQTGGGGETTGYLNITSVQIEDGGEYTCVARNLAGEAKHSARLNVYGTPYIRAIPKITAAAEADVSVKCPVAGYPIMEIVWSKGDEMLKDSQKHIVDHQNGVLTIRSLVQSSDRGIYTCSARDRQGHVARRDITLDVVVAPKITPFAQQGDPAHGLKLGERLTLTCAVIKGDLPLLMSWAVNGRPILPAAQQGSSVKTVQIDPYTSLLSVDSLMPAHAGNYTCHVHNPALLPVSQYQASQSQLIFIQVPPRIDPFSVPENEPQQLLKQGTRTRLLCGVSQGDKPLEFTWSKDGQQLSSLALPAVTVRDLDADSSVLTFTNLSAVHLGKYQCAARNAAGLARSTAQLYVQVPPFWVMEPRDVGALLGQTLTVHCQADGYPKPNVTWSRGDTSIPLTNRTAPPGLRLMENGTLIIRSARKSLQGRYTCRAVNRLGQELTATISVTVHAGPRFRDSASRLAVKRDVQVTLRCIVEGDGPLHLAWRRSSSATSLLSSNYRIRIQEKEAANGMSSTLTIPNAQIEDTGVYICVASNSHGQVERDFQLNILEPPEQPRQLQVRETFSRRVSLSWLPPTGAAGNFNSLIAYILQYKETNHGNWQERENLPAYSTSYILEGLQPSTSYQIRVLAETSADRGPPSEIIVVKTYGEAPGSSPTDLRVTTISSTRLRLSWNGLDKSNWHSSLIGYQLGFRPEEATSYNFTTIPLMDPWSNNNKMMEFTLYQLHKAVKYLLVVRAFNRHGEGPLSAPVSAVTMEDVPSASPQSVRCSTSSSSSVDVSWKAPPLTEQNGQIQQYQLHFERISLSDSFTGVGPQMKTVDGFHTTLTGLAPYSTYRFRVEAVNRKGAGPLSPPVTCLTDESVPGAPADIKAYSSGPSATTLCWAPPLHPNGEILHYTLSIKAGGSSFGNGASVQRHTVPAAQTHYELMSNVNAAIPPPSFYEIWLTATNRAGVGDKSKVLRHSPGFKPNSASASICSFGRRLIQPWRTAAEFSCLVIGTAGQPQIVNWTHNGNAVRDETVFEAKKISMHMNHSANHHQHSSLSLTDLKRTDSGNYSCSVGSGESITHHLLVLVPPSPPILHVLQTGTEHIQVEWKANKGIEDTQTSSSLGFLLHWRHSDGGDWEERELDRFSSSAQLDNLRCGTRYHIYVSSYNAVGTSPPSNTVTARTKGDGPLVPAAASSVVTANSSRVAIHLNNWQERGCPILSFAVEYKMDGETYWNTISEDVQNLPMIFIDDIQPSTAYQLRVRARTSAGSVPVQYDFITLDTSGQTPSPDRIHRAGRQLVLLPSNENLDSNRSGSHVILPWWLIGAVSAVGTCSLLGLMVACVCLYKTRNESRRLMVASTLPSNSTLIDGNATWNRSHKSGSTTVLDRNTASSKRSSTFELHSMGDKMSINYSPDDHDDIYPYATFELHRERPRSPKKMHDNPPDFIRLKAGRENNKMILPSRPPPSWSELSTIEIERHFQSSPTISDSELENLAVPPEFNCNKYQMPVGTTSSAHSIRGIIHQSKDYPSKSSLKRPNSVKDDYSKNGQLNEFQNSFKKHPKRPSHPVPKNLPTLRLVDQSDLWGGEPSPPHLSNTVTANSTTVLHQHPPWSGGIVRPKPNRSNGVIKHTSIAAASVPPESPLDHSIAV